MSKPVAKIIVSTVPFCLVNAWPFFRRFNSHFDWQIVYLLRDKDEGESVEVREIWEEQFKITTKFLGYPYSEDDLANFELSFDRDKAEEDIQNACAGADLLITHNHLGEDANIFNVFVNSAVTLLDKPQVYFGLADDNDNNLIILPKFYGEQAIPTAGLHWTREWIESKGSTYTGKYYCDDKAVEFIKKNADNISFTR